MKINYGKNDTLNNLKDLGVSLYKVHKELGVSYNTVFLWDKGTWLPNDENQVKLDELVELAEKGKFSVRKRKN